MRLAKHLLGLSQLPQFGEWVAAEAGYFFGLMAHPDGVYAYYVAPAAAETDAIWCSDNDRYTIVGASSALEGLANSIKAAALGVGWAAAYYCRNYSGGGKNDWFLGAREQLEMLGRNLSPLAHSSTSTTYGEVPDAVPPIPSFADLPAQASSSPLFTAGGAQALRTDVTYWCSGPEVTTSCTGISFATGAYTTYSKGTTARRVRPIRRARISSSTRQDVLGSAYLSGAGQYVVPAGVYSISVLCVDAGDPGGVGGSGTYGTPGTGGTGGNNGKARYLNNISVTPGQVIEYHVGNAKGNRASWFGSYITASTGGTLVALAPAQPSGGAGGGPGTTTSVGMSGNGHKGYDLVTPLVNQGSNTIPNGLWPGGGGGGGGGASGAFVGGTRPGSAGGDSGNGAIRIMHDGGRRQYPNTFTADEFEA